ncbi:MAG TPA: tryptophan synthase subunit alpha [Terriglobales bacterium]|nr:tryptophan synthase subunit alpha [Terriglobales bacterium]
MALTFANRPSLVAYLTCGDPDLDTTREVALAAIQAGAAVLELGVPFSDPVADGPVIQRASERALRQGTGLADILRLAAELRRQSDAGLIIFSYMNPILQFGLERFCDAAARAGIDGALLTDLPVEEAGDYLRAMRARDLATIFLAAPTSPDRRLQRIAEACTGFVYAVSRTGVTGERDQAPKDARDLVRRVRKYTRLPVAVGFGVSTPQQFAAIGEYADAAVVGSAIVHTIERNPGREAAAVREFVAALVSAGGAGRARTSATRA